MQDIREETRLQAANTIIMASSLGKKGKTIEVLAREIRSLSDKTNVLADDVTEMQDAMNHLIKGLKTSTDDEMSGICHVDNMEKELVLFRQTYLEIEKKITAVAQQIDLSDIHIQSVRDDLSFLTDLEEQLILLASQVKAVSDVLAPWQDEASLGSEEVEQLMARYTMEKERMVHMQEGDHASEDEDTLFFEKISEYQDEKMEQAENVEFF